MIFVHVPLAAGLLGYLSCREATRYVYWVVFYIMASCCCYKELTANDSVHDVTKQATVQNGQLWPSRPTAF